MSCIRRVQVNEANGQLSCSCHEEATNDVPLPRTPTAMMSFLPSIVRNPLAVLAAVALSGAALSAHANTINVVNGGFEQTLTNQSSEFGGRYSSQQVTGWTTGGYNFVFLPGTADTTGAASEYGPVKLWGPGDGSANGLTSSPAGGNYLSLHAPYAQGPVSTTLSALPVGAPTTVNFFFAGAQQYGYTGATTEQFAVSLGNQTINTEVLNDSSHGFTGWKSESLTFTATNTSEVLSFLAIGTPGGEPPMSLLDGVSVTDTAVPEPSSLALLGTGLAGVSGLVRRRFKK